MQMMYWIKQLMADDYGQILVWLIFILILMGVDVITGLIQAKINRNINSKKIGDGILKKVQILLVLIVIVPLTIVLPNVVSTTVIIGIYLLETYNELVSINENLKHAGIDTNLLGPITKLLNKDDKHE
ncbi:phage holin family protein [Enterococcus cecorum]|uniref:Phage holin family protein n=1 Tax=Enterococcus cecorum TaxID=44008 RepID=A0AAW8TR61_9ENTE|nr:phage holin family protein [Enterococcus cecorum]MCJ0553776.1 phage holin family protein [Enterococcus cecorum]MCJ0558797.1 phage holin family protein [Enterococcus cecorum]MCJ0563422.1 phage holin family protein [Enterococcus cecorum]MCJ0563742.1 phage holin family protein [Enterococcus cecorum]MDT2797906.1 phage holin family protein [Enterococcus cecorum]